MKDHFTYSLLSPIIISISSPYLDNRNHIVMKFNLLIYKTNNRQTNTYIYITYKFSFFIPTLTKTVEKFERGHRRNHQRAR